MWEVPTNFNNKIIVLLDKNIVYNSYTKYYYLQFNDYISYGRQLSLFIRATIVAVFFFVCQPIYTRYIIYRVKPEKGSFQPSQYQPITILVARTQCVFSVSLRAGKRLARTKVKRIVISPADKQKQNNTNAVITIRARVVVHA